MTELDKNTRFLSRLVVHKNVESQEELAERLKQSCAHERTLRRAIAAVAVLGLASVSGIGYSVLFEERFRDGAPIVLKFCYITGLASLICLIGFLFFWAETRSKRRHVIDQCRDSILAIIDRSNHPLHLVPSITPLPALRALPDELPTRKAG